MPNSLTTRSTGSTSNATHHPSNRLSPVSSPLAHPPTPRLKSAVVLELFHVKHSVSGTYRHPRTPANAQPHANHALNHGEQQAGCHPSAAPRSMSHAHLRRATNSNTSPPPLPQPPREDPMPRREDPGEHEACGEHQDDRGTRGHVQRPRQVQAHQAARRPQGRRQDHHRP